MISKKISSNPTEFCPFNVRADSSELGLTSRLAACVEEWLSEKDHALIDLMDICDAAGVEYVYATLGKDSVLQFRPSGS